ncbi:molybdate ABC transporter substrate-binding protein [Streptomyces huasconensis]|uniref:molybdate ABC transporter substrate-binding protein n=1 Tax=Streptomyces huasconensis TaxID=1854574 RepID=UPI0036F8C03F
MFPIHPKSPAVRRAAVAAAAVALLVPLAAACGGDDDSAGKKGGGKDVRLTILAASSLTDVFATAEKAYEKDHPGTDLTVSAAGSQELAAQVKQGSPADVLVTADTKTMDGLKAETGAPTVIAKNRLVIATREGNPDRVKGLKDLARRGLKVVLADDTVPVGRYTKEVLDRQGVAVKPVSKEANVRSVLSKVELGEADAGIVYRTDAASAPGKVDAVEIPAGQNAVASYPAATLKGSAHGAAAAAFVKWLGGPEAQKILRDAGFQKP